MLSKAADEKVGEKANEIVQSLIDGALEGNASATRLLVQLAEGADWVQDPVAVEKVLDAVSIWSNERQLPPPTPPQLTAGGYPIGRAMQLCLPAPANEAPANIAADEPAAAEV